MKKYVHDFLKDLSTSTVRAILTELYPFVSTSMKKALDKLEVDGELTPEDWQKQLSSILTSFEHLAHIYAQLSAYEQEVIRYFIFHVDDFLTFRQLSTNISNTKPALFRLGLTALRRKGFIYTIRRQWGEVAYTLPTDLSQLLYQLYVENGENGFDIEPCLEFVAKDKEEYLPIYVDIFLILDELRMHQQRGLPLTKKGNIHKRYLRVWQERLPKREAKLESLSLSYEHRDTYSPHMAILLDFLNRKQFITWRPDQLVLNQEMADAWMRLNRAEMRQEFGEYWLHHYTPSTSWLKRYQRDMLSIQQGEWIYLLSIVERWEEEYALPSIAIIKQQIEAEILNPLVGFGLIEKGVTSSGEAVWRWKVEQEESGSIWIQPTMEIFCSSLLSFSNLWKLTKLLQLDKWEHMLILRPTKAKLASFLEQDYSLQDWCNWLEELTGEALSQALKLQLETWQRHNEQVLVSRKTVIEIRDEQLANVWMAWPELADMGIKQIQPTLFLADLEHEEEIKQLFTRYGFSVKENKGTQSLQETVDVQHRGFLISFAQIQLDDFKVENIFPDLSEAVPAWQTLPDMWKKQLHAYNERTKRQIVTQAVEHALRLKVETVAGDALEITPTLVQVEDGHWVCYDGQNRKFLLEQLSKLQLLFPV